MPARLRIRPVRAAKEGLLWLLVILFPVGVACMYADWSTAITTIVTPNGGGTESEVEHSGVADLPGGSINVTLVGAGFASNAITISGVEFLVGGVPVPTSSAVDPAHQVFLGAEADAIGRNIAIHTTFFAQSDPVVIDDGDLITLRYTQSDGGTAPTVPLAAFVGTTFVDLGAWPFTDLQVAAPPEVTIAEPMSGEAHAAGSIVTVSGTARSELNEIERVDIFVNDSYTGPANLAGPNWSLDLTWPSTGPPEQTLIDVNVRAVAFDSVERTTSAEVTAQALFSDGDDDGLRDNLEAGNFSNPADPDTDGDGLSDGAEVFIYGTLAYVDDSDGDGQGDGREINQGTDPLDPMSSHPERLIKWERSWLDLDDPEPPVVTTDSNGDRLIAVLDRGPGGDHVVKIIKPEIGAPGTSVVLDLTTTTPSCPAPITVVSVGAEQDTIAIHAECAGSDVILVDSGSGLSEAVVPNEPLTSGGTLTSFDEFSLGRNLAGNVELVVLGIKQPGAERILATCAPPLDPCDRLIGSADLTGDEISRPDHMGDIILFLGDTPATGPPADDLFRIDRDGVAPVPIRVIGAGDLNPTRSTLTFTGVNDFAAGDGGAMVDMAIGPSRQLLNLSPADPSGFMLLPSNPGQTGRRAPDSLFDFGNAALGSFDDGMFAINASTTDAENGVWGGRRPFDDPTAPPVNRVLLTDRFYTAPGNGPGSFGSRVEEASVSRQAISNDVIAAQVRFFGGDEWIVIHEPGDPESVVRGYGTNPAGATTRIYEFVSSPAYARVFFQPSVQSGSGLAYDPTTDDTIMTTGFGDGGNTFEVDFSTPSVTAKGDTLFDAAPGVEIANGTWYVTVPTSGGAADGLATLDPVGGNATLVAPLLAPGAVPVVADALAYDDTFDELLAVESNGTGFPWTVHRVDRTTAAATPVAEINNVPFGWTPAGADLVGRTLFLSFGSGGGHWASVDLTGFDPSATPPVPVPTFPMRVVIDAVSGSMSDITITDRDGDGLRDFEESQLGTDPDDSDHDGDGLADGAEVQVLGTNPLLFDTDGDGIGDGDERFGGTDPNDENDPDPVIPITALPLGGAVLLFAVLGAMGIARQRARSRAE